MTKNQKNLICFIADYRTKYGTSPTLQEMAEGIQVSDHKSVSGIITALTKQEFLEKGRKKTRAILLTDRSLELLGIPLLRRQQIREFDYYHKHLFPASTNIVTSSAEYVGHGEQSIKTDGTNISNDLRTVVGNTVAGIASRVYAHEETGIIFRWALIFGGLTWANINFIGNGTTALVWTAIEIIIIRIFLSKKITL